MLPYVVRRVLVSIPLLWGVVTLVFLSLHVLPGDPAQAMLGKHATTQEVFRLRHELGLDQPLAVQYRDFVTHALRLDFGSSLTSRQPVAREILDRLPYTAGLAVAAVALAIPLSLLTGIFAAIFSRTAIGTAIVSTSLLGVSVPDFVLGTLLALIFGVKLHWLPVAGTGDWRHLVLPVATLAVGMVAVWTRLLRSALVEVLDLDFIRTARAKGVGPRSLILKHALRNALIPVLTVFGLTIASLLGGVVVIENVFAWPGLGTFAVAAITTRDFPAIEGTTFLFAVVLIGTNLLVDICYALINPRIRLS